MASAVSDLRRRADALTLAERATFRRRLRGAERIPERERRGETLAGIEADLAEAEQRYATRLAMRPRQIAYPEDLPITARRSELLTAIADNQVVIVAGETGSGKSTQIPKLCLELGRGIDGLIGHTQPRRIAARSIAERVAEEIGTEVGGLVGYTVRFTDRVGERSLVKVMTDGILLAEIQRDRQLLAYDTIIVDEAHERSLTIDFLLGYLKNLLPTRPDLKVIITSATIDTKRFSEHFDDAPVVEVSGRTYPVEVRYRPLDDADLPEPIDQPQGICDAVKELASEGTGDILVFCSGEREIRDAADALGELRLPHTEILPLYGRLSSAEQHRVFEPHTGRRIVIATNVAETSLTVPGVRSVVDTGTARISRFSRRTKVQRLPIEPISRASADQRAGRCGRLGPGVCIRLYSKSDYEGRPQFTEPEILRTNLASVILQMAALDLGDVTGFPFLEPPDTRSIRDGVALLEELGAIRGDHLGTRRWLTDIGRIMARLPLDPRLARMVIEADRTGCLREVLVIASALSLQDPRERPTGKEEQADQFHRRFFDERSDFLGWLNLWEYLHTERRARTSSQFRRLCRDEYLNYRRIREWQDLHTQLRQVIHDLGFHRNRRPADPDVIHKTLLAGLLSTVGVKEPEGFEYRGARGARFALSPASVLFKRSPRWVMAAELVETTRLWAHAAAGIEPEWIEDVGAHLVKRSYSDPWWDSERGAALARETATIFGLTLTTKTVQYGRIDQAAARELFIRHTLVAGDWEAHHAFLARNRESIDEVLAIERRERRNDLLVDDDVLVEFFRSRVPTDITTVRHFDRWWRDEGRRNPHLLDLSIEDLIDPAVAPPDESAFPRFWRHGDIDVPLRYEFDPSSASDGVVVEIPIALLDRLDPAAFEWHVPGHRRELITTLMRSLPKVVRKALMPISETVEDLLEELDPSDGGLFESVRRAVVKRTGIAVDPGDVAELELPRHLRVRFEVMGTGGDVLASGDSLVELKAILREEAREVVAATAHALERTGSVVWDFGELPRTVVVGTAPAVTAFPSLVDEGETVGVRLLATPEEQAEAMWQATRRLLVLNLPSVARLVKTVLPDDGRRLLKLSGPYGDVADWMDDCLACALDRLIAGAGGPAWHAVGFDRLLDTVRGGLAEALEEVAESSLRVIGLLREVELMVDRLRAAAFEDALADVARQLNRLIYPGFLAALGPDRLPDVERYLRAAVIRLEGLADNVERDRHSMLVVQALEAEHDRLLSHSSPGDGVIEVGWMLQELRVSLFAQRLGTAHPISPVRVRRALDAAIGLT